MVKLARGIKRDVERVLWGKAGGRCQFDGHNRLLYKSSVTQEPMNAAEMAHIYSFSENGPRGRGIFRRDPKGLNGIENLLLVCDECHKKIDRPGNDTKYSAELLRSWKKKHEARVRTVTGIAADKARHVVLYGANIGEERSPIKFQEAAEAMFPNAYPSDDKPIVLSTTSHNDDSNAAYWQSEAASLRVSFDRLIKPFTATTGNADFSLFALAPQPLLILLGTLFTDKIAVETHQLQREPRTWRWQSQHEQTPFDLQKPTHTKGLPVLVFSLSANIATDRIHKAMETDVSIWTLTVSQPHNDMLKTREQLSDFRKAVRSAMLEIKAAHGHDALLHIFPAMPVACAIELGRARMPKADMPWQIYDQNNKVGGFQAAIKITETEDEK